MICLKMHQKKSHTVFASNKDNHIYFESIKFHTVKGHLSG